jgi:ribosomal protein L37AE/L43A
MNKYKYKTTNKANQEIWVCETCKKGEMESILTGNWKLIDRSADPDIRCAVCDKVAVKERI